MPGPFSPALNRQFGRGEPTIAARLAARVLRKLGISIVADYLRPYAGDSLTAADVAARVLLDLGIPVAEADRPGSTVVVTQADIASRALRAVGINPAPGGSGSGSTVTYPASAIATAALLKLAVIASDETPSASDQAEALARVTGAHDILVGLDYAYWTLNAIPASVAEFYIGMTANFLAPQFGKPSSPDALIAAQNMIRLQALAGVHGQTLAEAKVAEAHEALNALGLVAWPVSAVPLAQVQAYVQMAATLLGPVMGYQQDAPSRQADKALWDAAQTDVRKAAVIRGAQARALAKVQAVQSEINALGLVEWGPNSIPAALADPMAAMAAMQMGPEFGREMDPKMYAFHEDRVRRVSMGGPAGLALAQQKIIAAQHSLEARGRARWSIFDVPDWAEESLVFMAAVLLAPEFGMKVDPAWGPQAEMELMRIVSLPSEREPVRATYF